MEKTIRHSKKRAVILTLLQSTDIHPSAEWIYQSLKSTQPNLSLGTVYRNLSFFQNQGMVKSIGVVNGQERFDHNTTPHSHLVCSVCSAVIDLHQVALDPALNHTVSEQYSCKIMRHELMFHGICEHCGKKEKSQASLCSLPNT